MIELANAGARQGAFNLGPVSCSIQKGLLTAVLGENGSGKTTLIRCITGLIKYTGSIKLDGQEISALTSRERARLMALLPQSLPQSNLTVREFVSLARIPHTGLWGHMGETDRQEVCEAISRMNLDSLSERRLSSLSGGEMRRAAAAQTLAQGSGCIILDEPTGNLDLRARKELWELAGSLTPAHTVIMITHDINEALRLADRLMVLDRGQLRFSGTKEECLSTTVIEDVFGAERVISGGRIAFD